MADTFNFILKAVDDDGNVKKDGMFSDGATKDNAITVDGTDVTAYIKEPGVGQGFGFYLKEVVVPYLWAEEWDNDMCGSRLWTAQEYYSDNTATVFTCPSSASNTKYCKNENSLLTCDTDTFYAGNSKGGIGTLFAVSNQNVDGWTNAIIKVSTSITGGYNSPYWTCVGFMLGDASGNFVDFIVGKHASDTQIGWNPWMHYIGDNSGAEQSIVIGNYNGDDGHPLSGKITYARLGLIRYGGSFTGFGDITYYYECDYMRIT